MSTKKQIIAAILLVLACGAATANTIQVDPAKIQFLGIHCNEIMADDISLDTDDPGHLKIDLNKMGSVDEVFTPKQCTIKIPFTAAADKVASSIVLKGVYTTPELEQIMATVGISRAGTTADTGVYVIKQSPTGEFRWKQPFKMEVTVGEENTLKIVISLLALPSSTDSEGEHTIPALSSNKKRAATESGMPSSLSVSPLTLVISHVVKQPDTGYLNKP